MGPRRRNARVKRRAGHREHLLDDQGAGSRNASRRRLAARHVVVALTVARTMLVVLAAMSVASAAMPVVPVMTMMTMMAVMAVSVMAGAVSVPVALQASAVRHSVRDAFVT